MIPPMMTVITSATPVQVISESPGAGHWAFGVGHWGRIPPRLTPNALLPRSVKEERRRDQSEAIGGEGREDRRHRASLRILVHPVVYDPVEKDEDDGDAKTHRLTAALWPDAEGSGDEAENQA